MNKLLAFFGLKWNPFSQDIPPEALWVSPRVEHFCARVEQLAREGGFALVIGQPGAGKSTILRLLFHRLCGISGLITGSLERPQSRVSDFYREIGHVFGVPLSPHNRWAGFKALREKWHVHMETTLFRPVLLLDEAQETLSAVLAELRLLSSMNFDSRLILTVVLGGDNRLIERLRAEDLLPLASRIRVRLVLDALTPRDLLDYLHHTLAQAGNPQLLTPELMTTLCEHSLGNLRVLTSIADEMLRTAAQRDLPQLDQKLYLELFTPTASRERSRPKTTAAVRS